MWPHIAIPQKTFHPTVNRPVPARVYMHNTRYPMFLMTEPTYVVAISSHTETSFREIVETHKRAL